MRCFIAIPCPHEVKERLTEAQESIIQCGRMKAVEKENMHLTLKFLGDISKTQAEKTANALGELNSGPFNIHVAGIGAFPNQGRPKVIWAGVSEGAEQAIRLHEEADARLKDIGLREDDRFHPHITIARVKQLEDCKRLLDAIKKLSRRSYGTYLADRILLMESSLTPKGPEYRTVCEKPL
ncbi:MAG: RNA 2',3'-cyclic phosphodiesterase [Candidatus Altiarchaeota archaeon]